MGYYYVRRLPSKKSLPQWKLQFISYKKADCTESSAKKPKKEWDIAPHRWAPLGFHETTSVEDAKVRARQLNREKHAREEEKRLLLRQQKEWSEQTKRERWLPIEFVAEFESRFIRARDSETESCRRKKSRAQIIWRAAQRAIAAIGAEPCDWFYHTYDIYDHFFREQISVKYIHVILKMMNLWGFFISRKLAQPFLAIPTPRGYERARLIENYYGSRKRRSGGPSLALTPAKLQSMKQRLVAANFN